ncbi:unnamed protein product, partial [Schistosoma turkestanicum]
DCITAFRGDQFDENDFSQSTCVPGNPSPIKNLTCCLSRQFNAWLAEKEDLKQMAADINGLMLSFSCEWNFETH